MGPLLSLLLRVVHALYSFLLYLRAFRSKSASQPPRPLDAPRTRLPRHLAVCFTVGPDIDPETAHQLLMDDVVNVVDWCRTIGIPKLTVYEETGRFSSTSSLRELLQEDAAETSSSESEIDYPLTPPPSDSDSRPISPEPTHANLVPVTVLKLRRHQIVASEKQNKGSKPLRRKHQPRSISEVPHDLTLCVASRAASKPAIASAARSLARTHRLQRSGVPRPFTLSVDALQQLLEDESGLSAPDFMILHSFTSAQTNEPTELHAFPPWHIRLTEICDTRTLPPTPRSFKGQAALLHLDQDHFLRALDEFATAEMRFGK